MMQILGIVIAFALIIIMVNKNVPLGYALIVGALIVGLFSNMSFAAIIQVFITASLSEITLRLVLILAMIAVMGHLMQQFGVLRKIVDSLNALLRSPKLTIAFIPSIMSTLLVTGGAILSAPLVDEIGDDLQLTPAKKTAINLTFRHGWFFIYPMVPGFILVSELTGVSKFDLISLQWPLTLVIIATSYLCWIRPAKAKTSDNTEQTVVKNPLKDFLIYSLPISSSLIISLVLESLNFPFLTPAQNTLMHKIAFPLGLLVGIILAIILGDKKDVLREIGKGLNIPLIVSGFSMMIFKDMVGNLSVLHQAVSHLTSSGVPIYLLFIGLPIVTGFLSASTNSAIGLSLPLLLPSIPADVNPIPLISLAYAFSFLGYYISPLHMCQILSLDYFKANMMDLYKEYRLVIPATTLTAILIYFFVR